MCERISWIQLDDGTLLYLTTYDLFDTPEGAKIRAQLSSDDWWGHSAIKMFYKKNVGATIGKERECTDYRSPSNFPAEIAQAIKGGKFRDIADPYMLTKAARVKCAACHKEWGTYDTTRVACDRERAYDKARACDRSWAIYDTMRAACDRARAYDKALVVFDRARAASSDPFPQFWELFKNPKNRAREWR